MSKNREEVRTFAVRDFAVEERQDGKPSMMKGVAIPYDEWDGDPEYLREKFMPGAFTESLAKNDEVRAYFCHDRSKIVGKLSNKTLRIIDGEDALRYELDPPDTTVGRDLSVLVERRDVEGTSIGFIPEDQEWGDDDIGPWRIIRKARLTQISPETDPWYKNTDVALRAFEEWRAAQATQSGEEKIGKEAAIKSEQRKRELELLELEHNGKTR